KNITKRYDTRALENEKNDLQQQLVIAAEKEKSSKWKIIFLIIIVIISTLIIYYNHRKKLFYKKRFEELISDDYKKQNKTQNIQEKSLGIPEEIVISILDKLSLFETKKEFLEQELTREILAQKFGTNTKYISKIINHYKNKNFRDYINDLRIEYSVKELKKNAELRKYTIKSIANEIGYKSVDSFSKAFKKHTGVQVSYFIRELKKS
ncbi:MAG: helix-turn-helix domain-containing protein, partial [Bacteroidota bacterium]